MHKKINDTNQDLASLNHEEALPTKFRSLRSASFNKALEKLPTHIQVLAQQNFKKWKENPASVKFKALEVANKNAYSAQVGPNYRAIAQKTKDSNNNVAFFWMWIGSHEEYNNKIKNLQEFKKKSNTILENLLGPKKTDLPKNYKQ